MPEYRSTYFHTVSMVQWKRSLGMEVFCLRRQSLVLCRIDWGHRDHKEQTSDQHRDNKSPLCTLIPSVSIQKKAQNPPSHNTKQWRMILSRSPHPTKSSSIFNSMSLSLVCEYHCSHSALSWFLSCVISRRVSSNYRPRSPLSWGFFHPIKFYYKRLTVTFTGSKNRARGIQCLFKWYGLFMEPSQRDLVE